MRVLVGLVTIALLVSPMAAFLAFVLGGAVVFGLWLDFWAWLASGAIWREWAIWVGGAIGIVWGVAKHAAPRKV